jgi:hypothetical protein
MILNLLLNYPDQNISNQFKPKKLLSYIKSLRFTPGRDIGSVSFGAVEDVVLWFHSEYRLTLFKSGTRKTISWSKYKNLKQHVMKEQRSASLQVLYRKNDTEPTFKLP